MSTGFARDSVPLLKIFFNFSQKNEILTTARTTFACLCVCLCACTHSLKGFWKNGKRSVEVWLVVAVLQFSDSDGTSVVVVVVVAAMVPNFTQF